MGSACSCRRRHCPGFYLLEAAPFLKNEEIIPIWQGFYDRAIAALNGEDIGPDLDDNGNDVVPAHVFRCTPESVWIFGRFSPFLHAGETPGDANPGCVIGNPCGAGAGDCFAGGLFGSLAEAGEFDGRALRRAIVHGSVVASFAVEDFGLDRLKILTREDIDDRYRAFMALTDFHS